MKVKIDRLWEKQLATEFCKKYFKRLTTQVSNSYKTTLVFPQPTQVFKAFELCPFPAVKVVILGQDPYHGAGQAHGLAFSVPEDIAIPPSLRNIYKELENDVKITTPSSGNLEHWARQGVLLLNATLTVEASNPGSHQSYGWETFTNAVIKNIAIEKEHIVFLLWGASAIKKKVLIDESKHLVLTAPHPSPLSAHRGFFGCKHFSTTNSYLKQNGLSEIIW
jgi:uracil-DNA glycosylase